MKGEQKMPPGYRTLQKICDMYRGNNTKNNSFRPKIYKLAFKKTIIPVSSKSLSNTLHPER